MNSKFSRHSSLLYSNCFSALFYKLETGYLIKINIFSLLMCLKLSVQQLISSPRYAINKLLIPHKPIYPRKDQINKFNIHGRIQKTANTSIPYLLFKLNDLLTPIFWSLFVPDFPTASILKVRNAVSHRWLEAVPNKRLPESYDGTWNSHHLHVNGNSLNSIVIQESYLL